MYRYVLEDLVANACTVLTGFPNETTKYEKKQGRQNQDLPGDMNMEIWQP